MRRTGTISTGLRGLAWTAVAAVATATLQAAGAGTASAEATRPGDIVSVEPSAFRALPGMDTPTRAWKIHYRSTDASGEPDVVSGTVIVPEGGHSGTRPLLTFAVGTVGMGDQCAPSATLPEGGTPAGGSVAQALLRGWAVVVTDYPGLGTPGDHTYLVGRSEGTAVLDAARAAQRLPGAQQAGVTADSPVGIMGYSQGGQASAWAAELAGTYAPELNVAGTASGGVPADLLKHGPDGGTGDALALMAAIGHDAAYPELDLEEYLNAEGRALAETMRNGCVVDIALASQGKTFDELTARNPLEEPDWQARLKADKLGTRKPSDPVFLYHGTADKIVQHDVGAQLRSDWCARGATVQWESVPLGDHMLTALIGTGPAMDWLGERFEAQSAQGNCG
ncbi:lipase [Actinomadura sp. CNU-125]|uniref:lipase family protein n=1 Tax=Actinomadura sp. CNU-125 TaxID=1904961 RepID=UPI000961F90A|nr:lipase family protein [Actinomadura sp. CNU-125]OLT20842.1 lipase [Actinomadura sp. CNU-125]